MDSEGQLQARGHAVLVTLFVASLAVWVGGVLFFSGVVLPALFLDLEPSRAGEAAALIFPWYYRLGAGAGLILLFTAVGLARSAGAGWRLATAVVAVMLLAQCYGGFSVLPEMQALRGLDEAVVRWSELHRLSVRLNGVVVAGGVVLLGMAGRLLQRRV